MRVEVVERLTEAVQEHLRVDTARALGLAEAAVAIARTLGDKETLARSLRAKANALYLVGDNRSSVELHQQSLALFEELVQPNEAARTLNASIQPLALLGQYNRAFAAAKRARKIFAAEGDERRLGRLENNLGNVFQRQDQSAQALACYQRAYKQLLLHKDTEGVAVALHNMAVCLISLNDFQRALETYQQARSLSEQHEMPLLTIQADYNIAYLYYLRGEYSRAIELLQAIGETAEKSGDVYHSALCHLDGSEIYLELNLAGEAAEVALEAFGRFQRLGMGYEAAKALTNLAIAASQQKNGPRALELFRQARAMFVHDQNHVWPSLIDFYRAMVLYDEGRYPESLRLAAAALEFFRSSALPGKAVLCHLLLARLSIRTNNLKRARRHCDAAREQLSKLESPALDYQAHFLMGQIHEVEGDGQRAYEWYQAARGLLEALRSGIRGEELKITFMKNRLEVYENLVRLYLARNAEGGKQSEPRPLRSRSHDGIRTHAGRASELSHRFSGGGSADEAFACMEQAKSRTLIDLIFGRAYPFQSNSSLLGQDGRARRLRETRQELNWYYHRIELEQLGRGEISPERIEQLQAQARTYENELQQLLRELQYQEPLHPALHAPAALTLAEIRAALPSDALLVEYFRVGDRIVAALLTRSNLEIVQLGSVSRVTALLRMLQFQLSKFRLGTDYVATFQDTLLRATRAHLQELYQEVFAPLYRNLQASHIIFVPHDVLHYLPFHALFDGQQYLIDLFTISYAPSATLYALCHGKLANSAGSSLVLGIPDSQAPSILEEVQSVAAVLPETEVFLGPRACEAVLREKGPVSSIVHIATHGYFRQDNPMFSGIRLGDTYLTLFDLYQLRLPVELITLSGCATGLNVVAAGDELMGLMRGLVYAGAQSLLLSMWDVHDRSTAEFMKSFYTRLRQDGRKASALRGAMREVRDRYPHPYYWAPFTLVGKVFDFNGE
jgi:CHAT domain-containing protein